MEENLLRDLEADLEVFNKHFPKDRTDRDIVVLRGHQLIEALVYTFIKKAVPEPRFIDSFYVRWELLIALARALKQGDEKEYLWVWPALISLEKARNEIAHNFDNGMFDQRVMDFVNCVRSSLPALKNIPGEDDLKKSIFVLYCSLSTALALNEYPWCTATFLAREHIQETSGKIIAAGLGADQEVMPA